MPHKSLSRDLKFEDQARLTEQSEPDDIFDLVGIGFGPASLAIAIALHDVLEERAAQESPSFSPKVKYLEQQASFSWHAGMLLPGTKMQISFIKDLATMRNPRSHFTFLNYLKCHNRLVHFCNLDTFLPLRVEFEDYLKWCAGHFSDVVQYAQQVTTVKPVRINGSDKVNYLEVASRDIVTGASKVHRTKNIVIAAGGRPFVPPNFPRDHPSIIHSSAYSQRIGQVLPDRDSQYDVAVIGAGQSAVEVFNDLQHQFPQAKTTLIMRDTALRPSDDSPFVNEIFNPEAVDRFYSYSSDTRRVELTANRPTNYGVVRTKLLQEMYEKMYHQRLQEPNPENWKHRILPCRKIGNVVSLPWKKMSLTIHDERAQGPNGVELLQVDAVILATGYVRDIHNQLLGDCNFINGSEDGSWVVERDYRVQLNRDMVNSDVSIYLQGCNEQTHGLSDTLLSTLAVRGGEVFDSVFGSAISKADAKEMLGRNLTSAPSYDSSHPKLKPQALATVI